MTAKVVELGKNNLADIPGMLRKMADMIEGGDPDYAEANSVVIICRSDADVRVSAFGPQSDYYYTIATIALAQHDLMR